MNNTSIEKQLYNLGRVFRILMETARPGCGANMAEIDNATRSPMAGLAVAMMRINQFHNRTPKIDRLVGKLLSEVDPDTEFTGLPMELRCSWMLGYEQGRVDLLNLQSKLEIKRKEKGLTQAELAERLDCSQKDISRWETGAVTPSTQNLIRLAKELNCNPDDLVG